MMSLVASCRLQNAIKYWTKVMHKTGPAGQRIKKFGHRLTRFSRCCTDIYDDDIVYSYTGNNVTSYTSDRHLSKFWKWPKMPLPAVFREVDGNSSPDRCRRRKRSGIFHLLSTRTSVLSKMGLYQNQHKRPSVRWRPILFDIINMQVILANYWGIFA